MDLKRAFILLLWSILTLPLAAQSPRYPFERLDINQGLSHNQVNCIFKDSRGFIWFGTMSGLNRYDGYSFRIFKHNLRDTASISDNYITAIYEGPDNKLWVNTHNGFNIYDPATETFDHHTVAYLAGLGISNGTVTAILKDGRGCFWFAEAGAGVFRYSPQDKRSVQLRHRAGDPSTPASDDIAALGQDGGHNIWMVHRNGIIEQLDGKTLRVIRRSDALAKVRQDTALSYQLMVDSDGGLWIYSTEEPLGVYYFNGQTGSLRHLTKESPGCHLNSDIVRAVAEDDRGMIWIGTDHGGINLLDKADFTVRYLLNDPANATSLGQNSVYSLYSDNDGTMWVGTYKKGVSYYNRNVLQFPLFHHEAGNAHSLPYDDVNCFAEDDKGNLWIGTNGGGLIYYDRTAGSFKRWQHDAGNGNSLSNDVIVGLCLDHAGKLWIGTYFGGMDCFDGHTFTHYRHDPAKPGSLADDRVWDIYESADHMLWIATLGGGLDRFDRENKTFYHYDSRTPGSVHNNDVMCIRADRKGKLWIGTADGVNVLDPQSGAFAFYGHNDADPHSLSNNNVISLLQDSRGWMWVGTREGLNLFNPQTRQFRIFMQDGGLPDNTILTMLEADDGNLWIGTPNGLSNLIIGRDGETGGYTFRFKNYDELNGLQGKEFNEKAAYKTRKGALVFGGANGFNLFNPGRITTNKKAPPVVLTALQVFNRNIGIGEKAGGRVILHKALPQTEEIVLKYGQDVFSIEFAALNYLHPSKNRYAYRLEGFNKEWLTTDSKLRKATYTNLDPGTYMFRVKASNNDGVWNDTGASLRIRVLPPFWRTPVAFGIYALLIIAVLLFARRFIVERTRMRFQMEQQQYETQRMLELDMMKTRFFTNVSHEFRTPLTLILTPLADMIKHTREEDQRRQLGIIYRNARRLLNLVNQLLDFRKMEVQEIKLHPSEGDIIKFLREVSCSFSDLSEKKNVRFFFHSNIASLDTFFDTDKLEKILFNLLSNAFKFTEENGAVSVEVNLLENPAGKAADLRHLQICVRDTGIGIPPEKQEKIFERFFQNDIPGALINQGSGIGLSITREFVKLHGGTVTVDSEPGKGSCFTVVLPLRDVAHAGEGAGEAKAERVSKGAGAAASQLPPQPETLPLPEQVSPGAETPAKAGRNGRKRPVILLVEDNEDFRFYLKDNLKQHFTVGDAGNGKEGWRQVLALQPDLVVSDIMMPELNGMELCRKIKGDPRTAHIPVLLLTAWTEEEQQMEGFDTGASEYITKPFNFEILLSRIRNLIAQREALKKAYRKQPIDIRPGTVHVPSADEDFIREAVALVERNMGDPDFSVESLSRALLISRVGLYKKLVALTGKTPVEFIRTVRLKRAAQLLEKSRMNISQVAYEVGFNNPKYFTRYFKTEFGVLPSVYAGEKRG